MNLLSQLTHYALWLCSFKNILSNVRKTNSKDFFSFASCMVLYEEEIKVCKAIKQQIINKGNQAHYMTERYSQFFWRKDCSCYSQSHFLKEGDHLSSVNLDSINHGSMENFLWSRNKVEARKLIFSKWFFQWVDTQHQGPSVFKSPKEFLLQFCTLKSFSKILFVDKSTKNQYWLQQFFIKLPNPWDEMHRKGYLEFLICQGMIFFINQNSYASMSL